MYDGILGGYDPLISPTGRAFMAGEKQGMTPEQMAQSGAISFADAIALKQMAERARASAQTMQAQQMPQPQPQPTVVDGYIGELRSQVAGSAAMPFREGGLAGLPVQNIGTQAMASGGIVAFSSGNLVEGDYSSDLDYLQSLKQQARARGDLAAVEQINTAISAALSAGRARRTQYEATRGTPTTPTSAPPAAPPAAPQPAEGISAESLAGSPFDIAGNLMPQPSPFGGAQGVQGFSAPTMSQAELDEMFRTDPYVAGGGGRAGIASLSTGVYKPSIDAIEAQRKDIQGRKYDTAADYEKLGIGAASKAQEAKINKELEKMPEDKRFAALMALSEAGFRMAGEASKPGATFLGSAAAGGTEGLKSYTASRKELREREERLGDRQFALAEKRDELRRAAVDQDAALRRGDQKSAQELAIKIAELESDARKLEIQMQDSAATRQTMLARNQDPDRELTAAYYKADLSGNTALANRILEVLAKRRNVDASVVRAQIEAQSREQAALNRNQNQNMFGQFGNIPGYSVERQ
jgi:hypothetical protein